MKRLILLLLIFVSLFLLVACNGNMDTNGLPDNQAVSLESNAFDPNKDFNEIIEEAKGKTVSFYGWGGDEDRNRWLEEIFAPILKEKYDIKLEVVGMDIDNILSKLAGEKQSGAKIGSIDMI